MRKAIPKKILVTIFIGLPLLYALLLIPLPSSPPPLVSRVTSFAWNQDAYWSRLESKFLEARRLDAVVLTGMIDSMMNSISSVLDSCETQDLDPASSLLDRLEIAVFESAPLIAAQPDRLADFIRMQSRLRSIIKAQSRHWDMNSVPVRDRLYRLLYGSRIAAEEIILQAEEDSIPALTLADDEPSATPAASILGVTIHSGDILISRGGAPTSALIARGNDYPGNFSHAALVHVNADSGTVSIIESHIERGVAVASIDDYLNDTKLRILVLRLCHDLPALVADPMLPHKAAAAALARARSEHIPYDFEMDYYDSRKLFCSEVVSSAYSQSGINLWSGISIISSPGIRSWLAAFGVAHFETQEPSDLEYDPQLTVIAEWRDPATLYKDHIDNAVIDVMLEEADAGVTLDYAFYMLPIARVIKGYSLMLNLFGKVGPIPEGMCAEAALKHDRFSKRHAAVKKQLLELAADFQLTHGYRPPYWELIKLARTALSRQDGANRYVTGGNA